VFEKLRAKRAEKHYREALATWQEQRDTTSALLDLAQNYPGEGAEGIVLKHDEAVFASVSGAALVEDRRGPGQWQGRSSGVSFPIGSIGGRSIRYHVGGTRGHYVQGAAVPTAIDVGNVFVTNQRVVFQGPKQTRECRFDKLIGFQHTPDGSTIFSVSNRQKPVTIHYGTEIAGWFDFRLDLALAHYRGDVTSLVAQVRQDLATIDAVRPKPPSAG
jgi:hypothetical protein